VSPKPVARARRLVRLGDDGVEVEVEQEALGGGVAERDGQRMRVPQVARAEVRVVAEFELEHARLGYLGRVGDAGAARLDLRLLGLLRLLLLLLRA
jgi:hypothetical protein